jgi:drug/metabolite transporter (DMT)-like permease
MRDTGNSRGIASAQGMIRPTNLRIVVAVLFALATVLFIVGTQSEKSSESNERPAERSAETGNEAAERLTASARTEESEKELGLRVESTGAQVVAVLISLAAIAAVLLTRRREWLYEIAVIAALFTVLDIAEALYQADHSEAGLTALAALVACLHAAATVGALMAAQDTVQGPDPAFSSKLSHRSTESIAAIESPSRRH